MKGKILRDRLHRTLSTRQRPNETSLVSPIFAYDIAKIIVKKAVWKLGPPWDLHFCRFLVRAGLYNKSALLYIKAGRPDRILSGPFKGMKYHPVSTGGEFFPKFAGAYEKELHEVIERACRFSFDQIIDVGAAEGYYAIGLALRLEKAHVYCYDGNPGSRWLLGENARMNKVVDRITFGHWCSQDTLWELLGRDKKTLLFCDCEGGEEILLNLDLVPGLSNTTIIVEIHDFPPPGRIGTLIRERFQNTHNIDAIISSARTRADLPLDMELDQEEVRDALDEGRPTTMEWLVMTPVEISE
jgi:hypothetical protein